MSRKKEITQAIEEIAKRNDDRITPQQVVDEARPSTHVLHGEFEWDDSIAGEMYRLGQARQLIRSVTVTLKVASEKRQVTAPRFVRDPDVEPERQGYISVPRLLTDRDKAREALLAEFERVTAILQRARQIAEALDMVADLDALLETIKLFDVRLRSAEQPAETRS